ncbi:MAG: hypothetical protein KJN90_12570 [Gammaproteobacteria bacterium]|nr:hypothetical protein [Gammaproteobacteria bacterium]
MTPYVVLALLCFASMIAAAEMAKRRGLNHRLWFLLAALIGPLALPLLFFKKRVA